MSHLYLNANSRINLESQYFNKIDIEPPKYSVYAPDPEELSNDILEKLEQAGRVPSKDKFRRMACNVSALFVGIVPFLSISIRLLCTLELVPTMIDVRAIAITFID